MSLRAKRCTKCDANGYLIETAECSKSLSAASSRISVLSAHVAGRRLPNRIVAREKKQTKPNRKRCPFCDGTKIRGRRR